MRPNPAMRGERASALLGSGSTGTDGDSTTADTGSDTSTDTGEAVDPVFPPGSDPFGVSYDEWGARWWEWAGSIPVAA